MSAALGLSTLVTRLARASGVSAEHDEVFRRVDELGDAGDARVRFESAVNVAGLRSSRFTASVQGLPDKHRALPAIAPAHHRGANGYVTVLGLRRRGWAEHFDVIDVDGEVLTISPVELAHRVGAALDEAIEWIAVEAALPMANLGDAHHAMTPWQRLRGLLRLEKRDLLVVAAYGIVSSLIALATPLAVQALVSTIAFGNLVQPLIVLSAVLVGALLIAGALRTLQLIVVEVLVKRLFVRLVADLAWRLPRAVLAVRDTVDGSKLVNRFFDVLTVQKATSTLLLDGFALALELMVALVVLAFYSDVLLFFSLLLFIAVAFVIFVLGRNGVASSVDESYAKHDVAGWLEDLVRHPTVFGTSTARGFGVDRSEAFTREYLAARGRHFTVLLRQSVAGFALQAIAAASLLGAGGALVLAGELTLGQLVAAELIVGSVVASLAKLGKQLEAAYDLLAAVDKIGHLVELEVERDDGASVRPEGPLGLGVDNLEIEVGTAPHQRPLRIGSFTIERGAEVAILGASGSGKSTLMDALRGARPASAGRIAIDGDDVRTLSLAALRARVAVAREGEIFEGTIAENLRIGRTGVPTRALVEALRAVELEDIVLDHREGLGRVLVPGSGAMSTGEVRRLMIARALVGAPGLIVIDGCLDALPTDLASRIIDRLRRLDATLIVLTTRADLAALLPRRLRLDGNGDGVVGDAPPGAAAAGRPEERR